MSSLLIGKAFEAAVSTQTYINTAGQTGIRLVNQGAQILNFSFGTAPGTYGPCTTGSPLFMCKLLQFITERAVTVSAASGNGHTVVNFPASDPNVLAVGGLQRTLTPPYFEQWVESPCIGSECGSNFGPELDLVAPAKTVLSTLYKDWNHNAAIRCGDVEGMPGIPGDGLGTCTGTSMAAPLVAGLAVLSVRSARC